jgi:hypothetical protein
MFWKDTHVTPINLNSDYRIVADQSQWIIQKVKHSKDNPEEVSGWNPIWFIASTKRVLIDHLDEHHIVPSPEAAKQLAALPDRFRDLK